MTTSCSDDREPGPEGAAAGQGIYNHCDGPMTTLLEPDLRVPDVLILINHVLLQKPQGTDASSAARTLAANLQQIQWAMKALHPP
jgi:hypothetical protein